MCELAELVDIGQRSGLNLHRAHHGFALEMRRAASLEAASQALGHADLATTMRHYGHWAEDELATAFEALVGGPRRALRIVSWQVVGNGLNRRFMEAGGIEPPSEAAPTKRLQA